MNPGDLVSLFDQQAAGYDRQWVKTAPIRDCLYLLLEPLFAGLPADARVLCVGVGTGMEMAHLAREPSGAMLDACRRARSPTSSNQAASQRRRCSSRPG